MQKVLVSRCLLGHLVRYDGGSHGLSDPFSRWHAQGRIVALCPEVAGGQRPCPPAEIPGGQGGEVLDRLNGSHRRRRGCQRSIPAGCGGGSGAGPPP